MVNSHPDEETGGMPGELTDWLGEDKGLASAEAEDPDEPVVAIVHRSVWEVRDA